MKRETDDQLISTETITSTLLFDRYGESDSEYDVVTFDATSDVGNEYYFVFDPGNKEIRLVYTRDDETMLLRFTVKAIF